MSRLWGMTNAAMGRAMVGAMFAASAGAAAWGEDRELGRTSTPALFAGLELARRRPAARTGSALFAGLERDRP
jgi:hypothetical protein